MKWDIFNTDSPIVVGIESKYLFYNNKQIREFTTVHLSITIFIFDSKR